MTDYKPHRWGSTYPRQNVPHAKQDETMVGLFRWIMGLNVLCAIILFMLMR